MQELTASEIVFHRLARNGLAAPFAQPLDCVRALAGIQSQFQQWAEVSIMNRCPAAATHGLADLYARHDILNLWGQRHTLHMYVREDWDAVGDIYEPQLSGKNFAHRRFPEDFAHLQARIADALAENHALPKADVRAMVAERLGDRVTDADYADNLLIHLCCLRGIFFGLPEKPGIKTFVGRGKICAEPRREDETRAARSLESFMLRYFQYYGPATLADFCHWSGLSAQPARRCLDSLRDGLTAYAHGGREYYTHGEPLAEPDETGVLLPGKFDPLFVSYRHKDWAVPPAHEKRVWRSAGWVEAIVLDGPQAVGTWRHTLKGSKLSVEVGQFGKIKAATRKKIAGRVKKLADFWDKQLDAVTFA